MIVIDAGVAVKWFAPEPGTAEAEALLATDEPRVAPEHLAAEVGQALLRHYREGGVTLVVAKLFRTSAGTSDCSRPRPSLPRLWKSPR